jgi:hypothetical protein
MVADMKIAGSVAVLALDIEMDVLLMFIRNVRVALLAYLYPEVHRFALHDLEEAAYPVLADLPVSLGP